MWAALGAVLMSLLFTVIVPLAVRLLAGLGIGFVAYQGASIVIDNAQSYVMTQYQGIPSAALQLADMTGGTIALNIIFAAYAANISIKVAMGVFTKFTANASWRS